MIDRNLFIAAALALLTGCASAPHKDPVRACDCSAQPMWKVCGADGKEYKNSCFASQAHTMVEYRGPCHNSN